MFSQLRALWNHPLARQQRLAALWRVLRWQWRARAEPQEQRWIEGVRVLAARGSNGITGNLYAGLHEPADMALLLHFLRPGDLFLDVGANLGSYSLLAGRVAGAEILAFEASSGTHRQLRANLALNGIAPERAIHAAAGAAHGSLRFTRTLESANHVAQATDPASLTEEVPLRRLDDLVPADARVAAMKIDTEGYELQVLAGAERVLQGAHPCVVEIEVGTGEQGTLVYRHMSQRGFQLHWYDFSSRTLHDQEPVGHHAANLLFVRAPEAVRQRLVQSRSYDVYGLQI